MLTENGQLKAKNKILMDEIVKIQKEFEEVSLENKGLKEEAKFQEMDREGIVMSAQAAHEDNERASQSIKKLEKYTSEVESRANLL